MKNRFCVENFLKSKNEIEFEFMHKSIYEYFAAENICVQLKALFKKILSDSETTEKIIDELNSIFNPNITDKYITLFIFHFAEEKNFFDSSLKNNTNNVKKLHSFFMELLNSCICTDKKIDNTTSHLEKTCNMFVWIVNVFFKIFNLYMVDENYITINKKVVSIICRANFGITFLYLQKAYLRGADLRGADLIRADLRGADLTQADLAGADLRGANLSEADLSQAYLAGADLRGANLRGANLSEADLSRTDLRYITADSKMLALCIIDTLSLFQNNYIKINETLFTRISPYLKDEYNKCVKKYYITKDCFRIYQDDSNESILIKRKDKLCGWLK